MMDNHNAYIRWELKKITYLKVVTAVVLVSLSTENKIAI